MGDRDAGRRGHRADRRYPRNDLELESGLGERERLLAAAAEDERVAALEADDVEPAAPVEHEQAADFALVKVLPADLDRVRRHLLDELIAHQPVVDEDVAGPDQVESPRRDQARVAGTRADEIDRHRSDFSTSASK